VLLVKNSCVLAAHEVANPGSWLLLDDQLFGGVPQLCKTFPCLLSEMSRRSCHHVGCFKSISGFDCHECDQESAKTVKFIIALLVCLDNCDVLQANFVWELSTRLGLIKNKKSN